MNLINLDPVTRRYMLAEIDRDIAAGTLYVSNRLSDEGVRDYPGLLREAAQTGTPEALADELRAGRLLDYEMAVSSRGKPFARRVPVTAPETLAEGEFNRYYIRGVCARALADRTSTVRVYRAKDVLSPRPESEARIGVHLDPAALLDDLRVHNSAGSIDTALGVPAGPNSGLSVQLVGAT